MKKIKLKELEISIVDYKNESEINELILFLKKLFNEITIEDWKIEYNESPLKSYSFISKFDNKIIGHSALIGLKFIYRGSIINTSKFEGSLIDIKILKSIPNHYNKRIFEKICYALIRKNNYLNRSFIFGFPSIRAISSQKKAGYKIVERKIIVKMVLLNLQQTKVKTNSNFLKFFLFFLNKINQFIINIISKKNHNIYEFSLNFLDEFIKFQNNKSINNPDIFFIFMDKNYFEWKFNKNNPKKKLYLYKYKESIKGYYAISINNNVINILDIYADSFIIYNKMLRHIMHQYKDSQFKYIDIWIDKINYSKKLNLALLLSFYLIKYKFSKKFLYHTNVDISDKSILMNRLLLR